MYYRQYFPSWKRSCNPLTITYLQVPSIIPGPVMSGNPRGRANALSPRCFPPSQLPLPHVCPRVWANN